MKKLFYFFALTSIAAMPLVANDNEKGNNNESVILVDNDYGHDDNVLADNEKGNNNDNVLADNEKGNNNDNVLADNEKGNNNDNLFACDEDHLFDDDYEQV